MKELVKIALKILGPKNIQVHSMGTDQPVFLVNNKAAVLIAPYLATTARDPAYEDGIMRLKDVAPVVPRWVG